MANCDNLLREFVSIVTPTSEQLKKMRTSRVALENKIISKYEEKGLPKPSFYTQGSSSKNMCTRIIKADGTYDVDRGVYLLEKPEVSAETAKRYIYEAVKNHTDDGASNKQKCVRVFFRSDYDVDFTAYYEVDNETYSYLAVNGKGWIKDDPSKMIDWFVEKKGGNNQLIRVVKYLKAWASEFKSFKMPSGIALTVWAASNFKAVEDRDDKSLLETVKAIKSSLGSLVYCIAPVVPYDDLVAKRSSDEKEKFLKKLNSLCEDAQLAVNSDNQLKASKLWRKHLGDRFPEGLDEDVDKKENALISSAYSVLSKSAKLSLLGVINESEGVSHQNHRNYGG